jgi:hypothetical protein
MVIFDGMGLAMVGVVLGIAVAALNMLKANAPKCLIRRDRSAERNFCGPQPSGAEFPEHFTRWQRLDFEAVDPAGRACRDPGHTQIRRALEERSTSLGECGRIRLEQRRCGGTHQPFESGEAANVRTSWIRTASSSGSAIGGLSGPAPKLRQNQLFSRFGHVFSISDHSVKLVRAVENT